MLKNTLSFVGIVLIAFVGFVDYMVVNNALPSIQNIFHLSILSLQWLSNVYSITLATTMVLFGRLGDMFGHRRIFYWGILLLLIGSLGAGLSDSFGLMLVFRAIQSLGISCVVVLAPGITQLIFQDKAHTPMSIYSTVGGVGLLLGPYLGGIIVMHWGWQWVFFVNVPILLVGFMICAPFLGAFNEHAYRVKIDWLGSLLLLLSITGLIYGLIRQQQTGFDVVTGITFLVFAITGAAFLWVENRQANPTLNLHFFKNPEFMVAILSNLMAGALVSCGMFFSPIFLQRQLQFSPETAGVILLTFAAGVIIFSPILGQLVQKINARRTIFIGLTAGLMASVFYILFFATASLMLGMIAFFCTGITLAANNSVAPLAAIGGAGEKNAGAAIGTIFSVWNAVAAIGLAIATVLFHLFSQWHTLLNETPYTYALVFFLLMIYILILFLIGIKKSLRMY